MTGGGSAQDDNRRKALRMTEVEVLMMTEGEVLMMTGGSAHDDRGIALDDEGKSSG